MDLQRAALIMLLQGKPCVVCKEPLQDDTDGLQCGLCGGFVHRACLGPHTAEQHANAAPPHDELIEPFAAFIASAHTFFPRSPYITRDSVEPTKVSDEDQARAASETTPPPDLVKLARIVPRVVLANPAADDDAREAARITLARWAIRGQLSVVSEHGRAAWLVDWIEHSLDLAPEALAPIRATIDDTLTPIKRLLAGDFVSSADLEARFEPLQRAYDEWSTRANQQDAPAAVVQTAHALSATGALSGSLYHALRWFLDASARPDQRRDWFVYRTTTNRWLPMWQVAAHCIAIGKASSAEWAAARMQSYAAPPAADDPSSPTS